MFYTVFLRIHYNLVDVSSWSQHNKSDHHFLCIWRLVKSQGKYFDESNKKWWFWFWYVIIVKWASVCVTTSATRRLVRANFFGRVSHLWHEWRQSMFLMLRSRQRRNHWQRSASSNHVKDTAAGIFRRVSRLRWTSGAWGRRGRGTRCVLVRLPHPHLRTDNNNNNNNTIASHIKIAALLNGPRGQRSVLPNESTASATRVSMGAARTLTPRVYSLSSSTKPSLLRTN